MITAKKLLTAILIQAAWLLGLCSLNLSAQVTVEDYQRADRFSPEAWASGMELEKLIYHGTVVPHWISESSRFWYLSYIPGGKEFLLVDAETQRRVPAFDHKRLAESLSRTTGKPCSAAALPFESITFEPRMNTMKFVAAGFEWTCDLKNYQCTKGQRTEALLSPRAASRRQLSSGETPSPDGKWYAFIRDYNLFIRSTKTSEEFQLSQDGDEYNYYSEPVSWAPDSQKLVAYYAARGRETTVYLIESAPKDQLRPKMTSRPYALPGDVLTLRRPSVFWTQNRPPVKVRETQVANAFRISDVQWNGDSRHFTFRYHQRGEQLARIIRVDSETGESSIVLEETSDTFIDRGNLYIYYVSQGREIIWSSERDGWRHLYLFDAEAGELKNQITKGPWVVRGIERVDEKARQIYFRASGKENGQDPYFIHYYRIDFDGTGLVKLTEGNGSHSVSFSPDFRFYVDTYSRVDFPPVSVLRRTEDRQILTELERADISDLLKTGWPMPEPFVAKGRDGKTDIYGVIYRSSNFDESISYPVIENIYAGPHGSHTPKTFRASRGSQDMAELGFIVVQMDGMGTANRSKAFHDVCWKNIADAGFPDRIAWIKAAAEKYTYMDISRVGIYGMSAGGQNSLGALLFHPEFYKVAVSTCGCHDNRMDKAVWNEQWMGFPVGPHFAEQSNVTNAHKLEGKLLLIVGELDTNVPPQSTLQVVDALIKAGKNFDLLVMPGFGHSGGLDYGVRRRRDYFVKYLLGMDPPDWNLTRSSEIKDSR